MIGKTLAQYRIVELLGKGGMGEVYRAQDTRLGREVALKLLPPEVTHDTTLRVRLEQEARAIAALHHPNIVTLFSVEEDRGRLFLTMELVRGPTLSEIAAAGLEMRRLLELALPLTEAVGAAHRRGVVHRDLKPSNVMLDEEGRLKVLDFGLAKQVGLTGPNTETLMAEAVTTEGMIVGTVAYISPEQAQGLAVDARSDVFSLGIILYEMATGRRPFAGTNPISTLSAIMKDAPAPSASMHPELARIVARCLEKDPARRPASAIELHRELAALQQQLDSGKSTPAWMSARPSLRWALLLVLPGLAFLGWRLLSPPAPEPKDMAPMSQVIVVFPFENLGRAEDAYFAEGMTDEIASQLTSVPGIGVISRTTAIQYQREGKTLEQIGKDLGVSFVLEGTIRWDRQDDTNRVRITPQLVRVADGMNAWSASFDRNLDDVFAIQSEIANQVVARVDASLVSRHPLDAPRTMNLEAYDYFLQAKEFTYWGLGPSRSQLDRAEALLEKSLALDPQFAPALAHLSMVHSSKYFRDIDPEEGRMRLAVGAAEKSLQLQPNLAEGHLAKGLCFYRGQRDYPRALEELDTARRLKPGDGEILTWIGTIRKRQGQFDEAREILHQAIRLDPRNTTSLGELVVVCRSLRDFESALQWADRVVAIDPSLPNRIWRARIFVYWKGDSAPWRAVLEAAEAPPGWQWAQLLAAERRFDAALAALDSVGTGSDAPNVASFWLVRARLHRWNGDLSEAKAAATQAVTALEAIAQNDEFDGRIAVAHAILGHREEAIGWVARARQQLSMGYDALLAAQVLMEAAEVYTLLGETSTAVAALDESLRTPGGLTLAAVEHEPLWDPLRGSAEFQTLLERHRTPGEGD